MNLSSILVVSPQAIARNVGEESVILDLEKGIYYGLDPVGARIWELMNEGKRLMDICTLMVDEYDVSRECLEQDIMALAQNLAEHGLVSTN